jgi:hypothetical protein
MDWRRQAVVLNGAESHNDLWRVGHGNAEWMFGTRNVPCFWLDKGVAHGCPFSPPRRVLGRIAGFRRRGRLVSVKEPESLDRLSVCSPNQEKLYRRALARQGETPITHDGELKTKELRVVSVFGQHGVQPARYRALVFSG